MFGYSKKILTRQIGAALTLGFAFGAVTAGPLVTQWSYSTNAVFVTGQTNFGSGNNLYVLNSANELSWGANANGTRFSENYDSNLNIERSGLTIGKGSPIKKLTGGGPATGVVNTITDGTLDLGDYGLGINITHWNNPISSSYATLTNGQISDTLTLTPALPSVGSLIDAPTLVFNFIFRETPNANLCFGETSNVSNPCPDLFGIVAVPKLNQPFTHDDNEYFVSVLLVNPNGTASPIGTLNNAECSNMGLTAGCQGFRTAESAATTAQFAFAVSAKRIFDVPTPAPLALMGLGFAVMGLARRAKSHQAG